MNPLQQPPTDPRGLERRGYEVDRLLRDYFRAEMPEPWPAAPAPGEITSGQAPARRRSLYRSRFALAASLLLLLSGYWLLSGIYSDYAPGAPDGRPAPVIGKNPRSPKTRKAPTQPGKQKQSRWLLSGATLT